MPFQPVRQQARGRDRASFGSDKQQRAVRTQGSEEDHKPNGDTGSVVENNPFGRPSDGLNRGGGGGRLPAARNKQTIKVAGPITYQNKITIQQPMNGAGNIVKGPPNMPKGATPRQGTSRAADRREMNFIELGKAPIAALNSAPMKLPTYREDIFNFMKNFKATKNATADVIGNGPYQNSSSGTTANG